MRQFLEGGIRRKSRLSSVPAVNARWNFWTERESLMGSKLFPEFLTKSSKSHAEVTKSNKRLVGLACIKRSVSSF